MTKSIGTGLSGFIGTHLKKQLKDDIVDIPHQRLDYIDLEPFDNFYFLSAFGNMSYQDNNLETFSANIIDPLLMINQAVKFNFKSFIYVSTSSVKLKVHTMYSRSKRAAEEMLLAYMEKYHKPICIVRPFSVTGVGEQDQHLIPQLIKSCMAGIPVNFVPDAVHDYIDVEDVVSGLLSLSDHSAKGIFELGSGIKVSNQEVLETVERVTGKKANIKVVKNMRPYDNKDWVSTNFQARRWGWLPTKTLGDSVSEMVEEYKQQAERGV